MQTYSMKATYTSKKPIDDQKQILCSKTVIIYLFFFFNYLLFICFNHFTPKQSINDTKKLAITESGRE